MKRHAQATFDYVLLICVAVAAILIMAYYVRNSLSGKIRDAGDTFGQGELFQPGVTNVQ
jgi:hypothetical protein